MGINCNNGYGCNHNKLDQAYFKLDLRRALISNKAPTPPTTKESAKSKKDNSRAKVVQNGRQGLQFERYLIMSQ